MDSISLTKAFNNHFGEFLEDIKRVFPNNSDILTSITLVNQVKKINPKLLPESWTHYVTRVYSAEVEKGDIDFFIKKDYSTDCIDIKTENLSKVLSAIDNIRGPISLLSGDDKEKCIKYMQNLTKLTKLIINK